MKNNLQNQRELNIFSELIQLVSHCFKEVRLFCYYDCQLLQEEEKTKNSNTTGKNYVKRTSVNLAVLVSVFIAVISPTTLNAAGACYPVPDGIVSWWPGNGNANDVIGSNNGSLINNVTFQTGMVGAGFDFDGTSFVQAPTTGLPIGSSSRTLELWVNVKQSPLLPADTFVIAGYGSFGSFNEAFVLGSLFADQNSTYPFVSQWGYSLGPNPQPNGAWYHVAATTDDNSVVTFFVNGVLLGSTGMPINTTTQTGSSFYIGGITGNDFPWIQGLTGLVDEVSIYNRALSQDEISAIFGAGSAGKCVPVPFNKFSAEVTLNPGRGTSSTLTFKSEDNLLGAASDGVKPGDEPFQLKIGNISVNLPANTLMQKGDLYSYEGPIANDRQLEVTVKANSNAPAVSVKATITGNNLNGEWASPVKLTIGNDTATGNPNAMKETYKQQQR